MKYLSLSVLEDFKCIGSACSDTCCAGWRIVVDKDSVEKYKKVNGDFFQKLNEGILILEDGKGVMNLKDGRCPFLNDENLCDIYINIGEDSLCDTCKDYPRHKFIHGDMEFFVLIMSCPEVARKILTCKDTLAFTFTEDEKPASVEMSQSKWTMFDYYFRAMDISIDIMQNRNLSFFERMYVLLLFNESFQKHNDEGILPDELFETFSNTENIYYLIKNTSSLPKNDTNKIAFITNFIKKYDNFMCADKITPLVKEIIEYIESIKNADDLLVAFDTLNEEEYQMWYEQYSVYYLFYLYMNSFYEYNPYQAISNLFLLLTLHRCFASVKIAKTNEKIKIEDYISIVTKCARVFEHYIGNMKKLNEIYEEEGMIDTLYLLSLLL